MARDINSLTKAEFESDKLTIYFAVELTLPDANNPAQNIVDRMWTGFVDQAITIDGTSNTFTGMGELLNISGTAEPSDLSANGMQIQIVSSAANISMLRDLEYQGKPIKVYLGAINDSGTVLEPILYFEGFNDKLTYTQDGDEVVILLSAEHKFIRLSQSSNRRYTHNDQILNFPTDKGFKYLNATTKAFYTWGV
jgi:hypothetical protein